MAVRAEILPNHTGAGGHRSQPPGALPETTIAQDPEAAIRTAMRLAAAWLLFQGVYGLEAGSVAFRRFGTRPPSSTLMALNSLIQMLTWNGKIYWIRPSPSGSVGPFVSHSHLAAYLNLGLGFVVAALLAPEAGAGGVRLQSRLWTSYAAGILVIGIVASQSRSGCSMVVALLVLVAVLRPRGDNSVGGLAGVGLLAVLLLVALGESSAYKDRMATMLASGAYQDRLRLWGDALCVAGLADPGMGLGKFPIVMSRFAHHRRPRKVSISAMRRTSTSSGWSRGASSVWGRTWS